MAVCGSCEMAANSRETSEIIIGAKIYSEVFCVEGEEATGYGIVFETGKGSFRISDISLERSEAEEFAGMILQAGDVPDYQVYELLDDFLGREGEQDLQ